MSGSGALFGRSDVARLLNIPEWTLANFADRRYPYGLAPSVSGGRGRGKKGLYTLADVYKIATAHVLLITDQDSRVIAEAVREVFPKNKDPMVVAVKERAVDEADARWLVIHFGEGLFSAPPKGSEFVVPPVWQSGCTGAKRSWVALCPWQAIEEEKRRGNLRVSFLLPFDELLYWVDSQILGRPVTFENAPISHQSPTKTNVKH